MTKEARITELENINQLMYLSIGFLADYITNNQKDDMNILYDTLSALDKYYDENYTPDFSRKRKSKQV